MRERCGRAVWEDDVRVRGCERFLRIRGGALTGRQGRRTGRRVY
jgi:hypothetical protein